MNTAQASWKVRTALAIVKRVLLERRLSGRNVVALLEVRHWCRTLSFALSDPCCYEAVLLLESYAGELLGRDDHSDWAQEHMPGAEVLRRKIAKTLGSIEARLAVPLAAAA